MGAHMGAGQGMTAAMRGLSLVVTTRTRRIDRTSMPDRAVAVDGGMLR